ncbi:hypothetical protein VPH35_052120 [Triticum aestivum]
MLGPLELLGTAACLVSQPAPSPPCVVPRLVRWRSSAQTPASSSPQLRLDRVPSRRTGRRGRPQRPQPNLEGWRWLRLGADEEPHAERHPTPSLSDRYLSRPTSSPAHGRLLHAPWRSFAWVWAARREEWIR